MCDSVRVPRLCSAVLTASWGLTRMARRSSTVSVSSPSPLSAGLYQPSKGTSQLSPLPIFRTPTSPWPPRNASLFAPPRNPHAPPVENPDELFTRRTVSEVMQVHRRLLCARPLSQLTLAFHVDSKLRATGLMQTPSRKNYGSWSGAYTRILRYAICLLELEFESVGNATAISCKRPPPLCPSRNLPKIPWTLSKTSSCQFRPRYLK